MERACDSDAVKVDGGSVGRAAETRLAAAERSDIGGVDAGPGGRGAGTRGVIAELRPVQRGIGAAVALRRDSQCEDGREEHQQHRETPARNQCKPDHDSIIRRANDAAKQRSVRRHTVVSQPIDAPLTEAAR